MQKKEGTYHNGIHRGNTTKSKTTKYIFICMPHMWLNGHKMTNCPKFIKKKLS
jgi:hypothetical protein